MKQHLPTILALGFFGAAFALLKAFGVMSGWPNIPVAGWEIPVRGETAQVVLSGLAGFVPTLLGSVLDQQWFSDWYLSGARIRELHAVKPQLVAGAAAANALGLTGTVVKVPVEAEKPTIEG